MKLKRGHCHRNGDNRGGEAGDLNAPGIRYRWIKCLSYFETRTQLTIFRPVNCTIISTERQDYTLTAMKIHVVSKVP